MRFRLALTALLGLAVAACGSGATESASTTRDGSPQATAEAVGPAAPASDSVLPSVEVIEVTTEEKVDVASLVPNDKPILLWFWAPH